jgi:hypothetical protein
LEVFFSSVVFHVNRNNNRQACDRNAQSQTNGAKMADHFSVKSPRDIPVVGIHVGTFLHFKIYCKSLFAVVDFVFQAF